MNTQNALNGLHSQLIRHGLPAEYAERAAAELADHHHDLIDELQAEGLSESQASAEASLRLGDSRTLVKNTVRAYQRRHFCGRWPLVTFLFGPLPMLLAIWVASGLALYSFGQIAERLGSEVVSQEYAEVPVWHWVMMVLAVAWFFFVTPAIVVFKLARMSNRAALGWKMVSISAYLLGLAVGFIHITFPTPGVRTTIVDGKMMQSNRPVFMLSIPMSVPSLRNTWRYYTQDAMQISQVLWPSIVVGCAFAFLQRKSRLQRQLVVDAS